MCIIASLAGIGTLDAKKKEEGSKTVAFGHVSTWHQTVGIRLLARTMAMAMAMAKTNGFAIALAIAPAPA